MKDFADDNSSAASQEAEDTEDYEASESEYEEDEFEIVGKDGTNEEEYE